MSEEKQLVLAVFDPRELLYRARELSSDEWHTLYDILYNTTFEDFDYDAKELVWNTWRFDYGTNPYLQVKQLVDSIPSFPVDRRNADVEKTFAIYRSLLGIYHSLALENDWSLETDMLEDVPMVQLIGYGNETPLPLLREIFPREESRVEEIDDVVDRTNRPPSDANDDDDVPIMSQVINPNRFPGELIETKSITKGAIGLCYAYSYKKKHDLDLNEIILFDDIPVLTALNNRTGVQDDFDYDEFMNAVEQDLDITALSLSKVTGKTRRGFFAYNNYVWQLLASKYHEICGEPIRVTFAKILGKRNLNWYWRGVGKHEEVPLGPNGLYLDQESALYMGKAAADLIFPLVTIPIVQDAFPGHGWLRGYKFGWFELPDHSIVAIGYRKYYIVVTPFHKVEIQLFDDDYVSPLTSAQENFLAKHQASTYSSTYVNRSLYELMHHETALSGPLYARFRGVLTKHIFDELNETVFESELTHVPITWKWRRKREDTAGMYLHPTNQDWYGRIVLYENFLPDSAKLVRTLAHEMCHAAVSMIDGDDTDGHGVKWKHYTRQVFLRYPFLELTTYYGHPMRFFYACAHPGCTYHFARKFPIDPRVLENIVHSEDGGKIVRITWEEFIHL